MRKLPNRQYFAAVVMEADLFGNKISQELCGINWHMCSELRDILLELP